MKKEDPLKYPAKNTNLPGIGIFKYLFNHERFIQQLSNLLWMPNLVSKGFDFAWEQAQQDEYNGTSILCMCFKLAYIYLA